MAKLPDSIDKYTIETLVAKGGMGAVYKGMHPTLKRPVILKKLTLSGGPALAERFRREARILMDFRHDHIVDVYDHFKQGGSYYIVLEYVDGESLDGLIKKHRYLDAPVAAYILLQSAVGLNYAHSKQVIHRDIKPANILISKKGEVKLVDFGIAVSAEDSEDGLTREGMTLGTPSYMAPEQFQNTKNVDKRADIYSLGIMLYESLTGKKPYSGGFSPELIHQIQKGRYKSPRAYNPKIDLALVRIMKKLMHYKPASRYQDLGRLILRLEKYLSKYDMEDVKRRLISLVRNDKVSGKIKLSRTMKSKRKIRSAIVSAVFLFFIVTGVNVSGVFHEMFLSNTHGLVQFEVRVPKGSKPQWTMFVKGSLFHDDNDAIPDVRNGSLVMIPNFFNRGDYVSFISLPRYLEQGPYRVKLIYENQIFWESFLLYPRVMQKALYSEGIGRRLLFDYAKIGSRTVNLNMLIHDSLTGKSLFSKADVRIKKANGWVTYNPSDRSTYPVNDAVNVFQVAVPGYHSQIYTLFIGRDQEGCTIDANLYPLTQKLRIKKPKAVDLIINGYPFYYSGEVALHINKIEPNENLTVALPAGPHVLSFSYRGSERKISVHTNDIKDKKYTELNILIDKNSVENQIVIHKK